MNGHFFDIQISRCPRHILCRPTHLRKASLLACVQRYPSLPWQRQCCCAPQLSSATILLPIQAYVPLIFIVIITMIPAIITACPGIFPRTPPFWSWAVAGFPLSYGQSLWELLWVISSHSSNVHHHSMLLIHWNRLPKGWYASYDAYRRHFG